MSEVRSPTTAPVADGEVGVAFPLGPDGHRSTTATGRAVFADAARAVDPALAEAITREDDWRSRYGPHLRGLVAAEIRSGDGVAVARAGLRSVHERFELARDGHRRPVRDAVAQDAAHLEPPAARTVVGEGEVTSPRLTVPYRGRELAGDELHRQLDTWVDDDVVEASCAEALRQVIANPDWLDLSDHTVALIGAGAEMGPLPSLCRWRARVLAIDLPSATERIERTARAGNATVHLPVLGTDGLTGADLLRHVPELAAWLGATDGPLVLGTYAYADGADHVRVAVAADALADQLCRTRDDVALAMLATPTDVFAVPDDLVGQVRTRAQQRRVPVHERLVRSASRGALYRPSYDELVVAPDGRRFGFADAQVAEQGPNYALAKRLQRWRAVVAHAEGRRSSANVAPATSTRSVTKNRLLAAAYAGAHRFGVEVFAPATSNALMAGLLVHDLRRPADQAPDGRELFIDGAAHGGLWRTPWEPPSVLGLAAARGLLSRRS